VHLEQGAHHVTARLADNPVRRRQLRITFKTLDLMPQAVDSRVIEELLYNQKTVTLEAPELVRT
jgi:hypothetical protein